MLSVTLKGHKVKQPIQISHLTCLNTHPFLQRFLQIARFFVQPFSTKASNPQIPRSSHHFIFISCCEGRRLDRWASCHSYFCDWSTSWSCHGFVKVFIFDACGVALALMYGELGGSITAPSLRRFGVCCMWANPVLRWEAADYWNPPAVMVSWALEFLVRNVVHLQPSTIDACCVRGDIGIQWPQGWSGRGRGLIRCALTITICKLWVPPSSWVCDISLFFCRWIFGLCVWCR